jgi:hypothetical protein
MSATIQRITGLNRSYLASVFDPMVDEFDFCELHGLQLSPGHNHGWIVRATPSGIDAGPVLGCVEESEDQFELMQVEGGFRWSIHDSLHDALLRLVAANPLPALETSAASPTEAGRQVRRGQRSQPTR